MNKCDDLEKTIIAEYYQRCFGEDLPESTVNIKTIYSILDPIGNYLPEYTSINLPANGYDGLMTTGKIGAL